MTKPTAIKYVIIFAICIFGLLVATLLIYAHTPDLPKPEFVEGGEKHRFIRYMSCAIAMCSKGYGSDEVNSLRVEFEGGVPIKNCNQLIDEKVSSGEFPSVSDGDHLCGPTYPLNFKFKNKVTYITEYSGCDVFGIVKPGLQTDVSCIAKWKGNLINRGCFSTCCLGGSGGCRVDGPVGGHILLGDECEISSDELLKQMLGVAAGTLWVPPSLGVNCEPFDEDIPGTGTYAKCTFEKDEEVWFWTEASAIQVQWERDVFFWYLMFCLPPFGTVHLCPFIIIYDQHPSNCP